MTVVFDLDDTLFDEIDYLLSAYWEIARLLEERGTMSRRQAFSILESNRGRDAFDRLLDSEGENVTMTVAEMVDIYRTHTPRLTLPAEVESTLNSLKANPKVDRMAVMTDGRVNTQTAKFNALGLDKWIDPSLLVISEAAGGDKLSGLPHAVIERLTSASPDNIMYIGDNVAKDFIEANRRGWITVMVPPGPDAIHHATRILDKSYRPQVTLSKFADILEIL